MSDGERENHIKDILIKTLPLIAYIIPFLILYFFQDIAYPPYPYYPYQQAYGIRVDTFEMMWKGRAFYIFFIWLASLEMVLGWSELHPQITLKQFSSKNLAFFVSISLPTIYIILSNFLGLNKDIVDWAWQNNIPFCDWMPLSTEYLALAAFYILIIFLEYGVNGLRKLSLSCIFLATIGFLYTIDNIYPYGQFRPFQIFVPLTAILAANVLNVIGYQTVIFFTESPKYGWMPILHATYGFKSASFGIAWPCSGVESFLIYTLITMLFLKEIVCPKKYKVVYFSLGALVTYFVNVTRIVTIVIIALNTVNSLQFHRFHDFYGQLYAITWITLYPLIILTSQTFFKKHKNSSQI